MNRLLALVVHNWPLKLAAVALATLLYAGLVLSRDAESFQGRIRIDTIDQPEGAVVVSESRDVDSIRYIAAAGVGDPVADDFRATVDLSDVEPGMGPQLVPVDVTSEDPRIRVIGWSPDRILVDLDPLAQRSVAVRIDRGPVPNGMEVGTIEVSPATVTVVGPSTEVSRVHEVVATVSLDPSGLDFQGEVQPTALGADGNELRRVDVEPTTVRVTVPVFSDRQTESLPIEPVVTGTPAIGYRIRSVEVQPTVVGVEGDADDVAGLLVANTQQLSVNGRTEDFTEDVELALPNGVRALEVDTVRVTVRIAPISETRTLGAGLRVAGAPAGSTVTLSSDRVLVALFGPVSAIEAAASGALLGTVDVAGLGPGTHEVPVVVTAPPGLTVADVSPPTIRVTIAAAGSASAAPTPTPAP